MNLADLTLKLRTEFLATPAEINLAANHADVRGKCPMHRVGVSVIRTNPGQFPALYSIAAL